MSKAVIDLEQGLDQRDLALWATELNNTDFIKKARAVARLICAVSGSVTMDDNTDASDHAGATAF